MIIAYDSGTKCQAKHRGDMFLSLSLYRGLLVFSIDLITVLLQSFKTQKWKFLVILKITPTNFRAQLPVK